MSKLIGIVCSVLLILWGGLYFLVPFYLSSTGDFNTPKVIIIPKGASSSQIIQVLSEHEIIKYPILFKIHVMIRGIENVMKAGEYEFRPCTSHEDLIQKLITGKVLQYDLTIPEGLTTQQIIDLLRASPFLAERGITAIPEEGTFLPETYAVSRGDYYQDIIQRGQKAMNDLITEQWPQRDPTCHLKDPQQAIILASIVEKEAVLPEERAHIAGVFLNRLRNKMRLQADPTVRYGLGQMMQSQFTGSLTIKDLQKPTPYNTYLIEGLPPAPICNPGKASIQAVLHPQQTADLYFVADGTGGHVFSKSYKEHQKNHQKWRQIRAKLGREKNNIRH